MINYTVIYNGSSKTQNRLIFTRRKKAKCFLSLTFEKKKKRRKKLIGEAADTQIRLTERRDSDISLFLQREQTV